MLRLRAMAGVVLSLVMILLLVSCTQQQPPSPPPDTRAQDEAAIRRLAIEFDAAGQAKDVEKFLTFYAPDASLFPGGMPLATGPEAIRKVIGELMALPGFALKFGQTKVEVARSGDLAYDNGTYELTANDAKGKPVTEKGKYVTVWKKQPDGSWKVLCDIFNADHPTPH